MKTSGRKLMWVRLPSSALVFKNIVLYLCIMIYGLLKQRHSQMPTGVYYFEEFADSLEGLDQIVEEWRIVLKILDISLERTMQIRSDPEGLLEDWNYLDVYRKKLNEGKLSIYEFPHEINRL